MSQDKLIPFRSRRHCSRGQTSRGQAGRKNSGDGLPALTLLSYIRLEVAADFGARPQSRHEHAREI